MLLPALLCCRLAAAAPVVDESWSGAAPPVVGEGEPTLTVVVRGAPESPPLRARLGGVEGRLPHLGLAVFALGLRGVPEEGRLVLQQGERTVWADQVVAGPDALVLLAWRGSGRIERLPAARDAASVPASPRPWWAAGWLALCVGAVAVAVAAGGRRA